MKTSCSQDLFSRLEKVMPGGNTRAVIHYDPFPLGIERGEGCRIWDVDGNEYLDFLNNYLVLIHGHATPQIVEAIARAAANGTVVPAPTALQAELAERLCARFPSIESVRFTNSGTEAVMMAVRAARAFTGREGIVKAEGGYHGTWDQVDVGTELETEDMVGQPTQSEQGIPAALVDLVHSVRYNNMADLEATMEQHGETVAAIIMEPVLGHLTEPGDPEFMRAAQRLAKKHGALLILDEVVTSRLHVGGWQGMHDLRPDLTTLGKIIGGGLPIGAFGGRESIMQLFDPRRPGYLGHHGTFNGNQLSMAAGCACLDLLDQPAIDRVNGLCTQFVGRAREAAETAGTDVRITSIGSILQAHSAKLQDLHRACLEEGLYIAPRGQMSLSTPMDAGVIDEAVDAWTRALKRVDWT